MVTANKLIDIISIIIFLIIYLVMVSTCKVLRAKEFKIKEIFLPHFYFSIAEAFGIKSSCHFGLNP